MPGTPPPPAPSGGTGAPAPPPPPALSLTDRLADAEAALARTRAELEAARRTRDEQDAARRAALEAPALHDGAGGAGRRRTSGPALDGADGGPAPAGTTSIPTDIVPPGANGAADERPFVLPTATGGIRQDDYANVGDGEGSESPSDWVETRRAVRVGRGGIPRHVSYPDDAGIFNDGFDEVKVPAADDWLMAFDVPRSILRPDGMPVPFTPDDNVHSSTFNAGSRDELEARHWYCALAWTQTIHNELLDGKHAADRSAADTEQLLTYALCGINRLYAISVSRYDYLALKQSEPALAEAFAHSDAVPRNTLRGDGARRYLSRVVRQETHASAKIGAAERSFSYNPRPTRSAGGGGSAGPSNLDGGNRSGRHGGGGGGGAGAGAGAGRGGGGDRGRSRGGRGGRGGSRA